MTNRSAFELAMLKLNYPHELFSGFYAEDDWAYYDKSANMMYDAWQAALNIESTDYRPTKEQRKDALLKMRELWQESNPEGMIDGVEYQKAIRGEQLVCQVCGEKKEDECGRVVCNAFYVPDTSEGSYLEMFQRTGRIAKHIPPVLRERKSDD